MTDAVQTDKGERAAVTSAAIILFAIVVLTTAAGALSQTAISPMLPAICADLNIESSLAEWLTTSYMLVMGVAVPIVTYLSAKFSLRRLIFIALGLMIAGAVIDFLAFDFTSALVGRILQAAATGLTLPLLQTVAMTRFPSNVCTTAMGVGGIALGFAPNIGPSVGGIMVDSTGWRSFFVLLLALSLILVVATMVLVRGEKAPARDASLDMASFALSTCGFGGMLLGFSNAAGMALTSPFVWVPLIVGIVCLVVFVRRQRRITVPLINMDIFKSKMYVVSFIIQMLLFASFMGITLILPMYVQGLCGGSATLAGLVFIPNMIFALIFNPLSGILSDKIGIRPVVLVGSAFLAVGAIPQAFFDANTPFEVLLFWQTIRGIGVSSLIGPLVSWGLGDLDGPLVIHGSSFATACRQASASLGTALMVMLIFMGDGAAWGYHLALGFSGLCALGVFVLSVVKLK